MLLSMTGYGAGQADGDGISVAVEVRTVNNRFLKLYTRLPDGFAAFESRIEELVRAHVRRGTVQLNVDVKRDSAVNCAINLDLVRGYYRQLEQLRDEFPGCPPVSIDALLLLPGVVDDPKRAPASLEDDWEIVARAVEKGLLGLRAMRETEGATMLRDLLAQSSDIEKCAAKVQTLAPRVVEAYQTRLVERINKHLAEHDVAVQPSDLIREIGIFSERADISEEIVRLRSHMSQFHEVMEDVDAGGGRKLEFLVQEILRETNTIGSKSNDSDIAREVVHIKTCIERIREMVQNIE